MLLAPVHGGVRSISIGASSERAIGRDVPWACEALKTGVDNVQISRSQVWVRCENGALIVENIGIGRARIKWTNKTQERLRPMFSWDAESQKFQPIKAIRR